MSEEIKILNKRKNPFCVISKVTYDDYALHDIQTNSTWTSNPYGADYAVVSDNMVEDILATCGYCDIVLNDDETEVLSFTVREIPIIPEPEPEPTTEDDLMAMAIEHEYRIAMLELFSDTTTT